MTKNIYKMADKLVSILAYVEGAALILVAFGISLLGGAAAGIFGFAVGGAFGALIFVYALYRFGVGYIFWDLEHRSNTKSLIYKVLKVLSVIGLIISLIGMNLIGIIMSGYIVGRIYKVIK